MKMEIMLLGLAEGFIHCTLENGFMGLHTHVMQKFGPNIFKIQGNFEETIQDTLSFH